MLVFALAPSVPRRLSMLANTHAEHLFTRGTCATVSRFLLDAFCAQSSMAIEETTKQYTQRLMAGSRRGEEDLTMFGNLDSSMVQKL